MPEKPFVDRLRPVRSYVLRGGRCRDKYAACLERDSVYRLKTIEEGVAWSKRTRRVLEIGFGMGDGLLENAHNHQNSDYFGIEVHRAGVGRVLSFVEQNAVENVRVWMGDAWDAMGSFPKNFFEEVNIFFPDPWPKKKHHKRRLVQKALVERVSTLLVPQGILHIATDWDTYAEHILSVVKEVQSFIKMESSPADARAGRPLSKFESRALKLGHHIYDLRFQKLCD
jgi:tRNA (guanine-N7-)-methyltransferase